MRISFVKAILIATAILTMIAFNVMAQAPQSMVYQGRLADADGNPISTERAVVFSIYAGADDDVAAFIWQEEFPVTPDDQGVFTVELGLINPLTAAVFSGGTRYLGIKVGDDAEMEPRQVLSSAPYAISANPPRQFNDTTYFRNRAIFGENPTYSSIDNISIHKLRNDGTFHYGIVSDIENDGTGGVLGVYGEAQSDGSSRYGLYGYGRTKDGSLTTGTSFGVYGTAYDGANAYGLYGYAGSATSNYGVYAYATTVAGSYAGYFSGNAVVTGTLSKGAGTFRIDHPLDPANKYLQHSFVESPDMMNVYNGNITTDNDGLAVVGLPDYFGALNKDFRYQLTVIGDFAQAVIAEEIEDNQFTIKTDKPGIKVSWQVTGIRKDAFAEANRVQVEVDKPTAEKGLYLHPEAFKLGPEMQIHYRQNQEAQKIMAPDGGVSHE